MKMVWDLLVAYGLIALGSWGVLGVITLYDRWKYPAEPQPQARRRRVPSAPLS